MTTLERILAKALTEIALLQDLSDQPPRALAGPDHQFAEETDPERHLTAWETPETLGLLA